MSLQMMMSFQRSSILILMHLMNKILYSKYCKNCLMFNNIFTPIRLTMSATRKNISRLSLSSSRSTASQYQPPSYKVESRDKSSHSSCFQPMTLFIAPAPANVIPGTRNPLLIEGEDYRVPSHHPTPLDSRTGK